MDISGSSWEMFEDISSVSGLPTCGCWGLVQQVYVIARGELVRVALRVRMGLSVGPEWTKWALDRGSGGSWFPNPYWVE